MSRAADIELSLDLTTAQRHAERTRDLLLDVRRRMDLAPFEYCKQVRIAPFEIPFSHPRITLSGFARDDLGLLCMYLHEQMHWYVTWYSHVHASRWQDILDRIEAFYPDAPVGGPEGAQDRFSAYLHLIVNWCEIDAVSQFMARERVIAYVGKLPFYRWIYRTVIDQWDELGAIYRDAGLVPIKSATTMSADDIKLASLGDKTPE